VGERLLAVSQLRDWEAIVPVSATNRIQLDVLLKALIELLPTGPALYPDDATTDETLEGRIAELIREAALEGVRDELPHSIAVQVDEMLPHEGRADMVDIYASLYVERDSQKAIVIGAKGSRLRDVGAQARGQIERLLGTRVYLDLRVRVAKDWQRDPKQLRRLGF
jgi:GTP-binding protein Era